MGSIIWKQVFQLTTLVSKLERRLSCHGSNRYSGVANVCSSQAIVLHNELAVPQLRQLVAGFPPWRHGFEPTSLHEIFVVKKAVPTHSTDCSTLTIYHSQLVQ
jgi:hypothetical protein